MEGLSSSGLGAYFRKKGPFDAAACNPSYDPWRILPSRLHHATRLEQDFDYS
jgi:hypothetical protein